MRAALRRQSLGIRGAAPAVRPGGFVQTGARVAGRGLGLLAGGLFGNALAILQMVYRRARANSRLLAATTFGLVITVTLVCAVPLYSDGVSEKLLHQRLLTQTDKAQPPASLLFHWVYNSGPPGTPGAAPADPTAVSPLLTPEQYNRVNGYLVNNTPGTLDLPLQQMVRYGATDKLPVYSLGDKTVAAANNQFKDYLSIGFLTDLQQHIVVTQGTFPNAVFDAQHNVQALATDAGAQKLLIKVGDVVTFANPNDYKAAPISVRIVGTWKPKDPNEGYWFYRPDTFDDYLLVPENSYFNGVLKVNPRAPYEYYWFFIFNQADIHSTNVDSVINGSSELTTTATSLLPGVTLDISPVKVLEQFVQDSYFLKVLLFALSAPTLAIVLYYILLASSMLIDKQRNEIAVLKSRGASTMQVLGVYVVEGGFISVVALVIGPALAALVAQFIGFTYTFLFFVNRGLLPVRISADTYRYAFAALALSLLAILLPAAGAARHTIISYKAEVARSTRKPFWQRYFLDFAVLAIAIYGYKLLKDTGSLLAIDQNGNALQNPLLLLVPAFFMFAIGLVALRVFPLVTELLAWAGNRVFPLSILLGLRHISRTPAQYTRLVLLLTLTMSLGVFSASMAQTLDQNISDHVMYQNGADLTFLERGDYDQDHQIWTMEPIQRYQGLKGVAGATRQLTMNKASVATSAGGNGGQVTLVGIDAYSYPNYAWYRPDLNAPVSEAALMAALKGEDDAVLASTSYLAHNRLNVGDTILLRTASDGGQAGQTIPLVLRGAIGALPTIYPSDGDFFVANLDYILGITGQQPWTVLMRLAPGASPSAVREELAKLPENPIYQTSDAVSDIYAERSLPESTGLFGSLTVGFLVATLLTVMGFLLYSFLSYQRRLQQLGIMRAIGLSVWGLVALLGFEQLFLIILGVLLGTAIGRYASSLFIPFMHIDLDNHANVPPFVVHTPWDQIFKLYLVLGIMLALAMPVMVAMLLRMKIHEATKLGEEQG